MRFNRPALLALAVFCGASLAFFCSRRRTPFIDSDAPAGALPPSFTDAPTGALQPFELAARAPPPWPPLPSSTRRVRGGAGAPAPPAWCAGVRSAPTFTPAERALADAHFSAAARRGGELFEWGAGSSTLAAAAAGVSRISTVDTVAGALACVLTAGGLEAALGDNITALHVEVHGERGEFGNPVDEGARDAWPHVSGAVLLHPAPAAIHVVLVDGRFRAASIYKAAAVATNAVILVHDWDTRPAYHGALKKGLLEVVGSAGRLVALRRTEAAAALLRDGWERLWKEVEFDKA